MNILSTEKPVAVGERLFDSFNCPRDGRCKRNDIEGAGSCRRSLLRNLPCKRIECDVIWAFGYAKNKNLPQQCSSSQRGKRRCHLQNQTRNAPNAARRSSFARPPRAPMRARTFLLAPIFPIAVTCKTSQPIEAAAVRRYRSARRGCAGWSVVPFTIREFRRNSATFY